MAAEAVVESFGLSLAAFNNWHSIEVCKGGGAVIARLCGSHRQWAWLANSTKLWRTVHFFFTSFTVESPLTFSPHPLLWNALQFPDMLAAVFIHVCLYVY